jgi:isocitrate dehydrogenase (NAD+)
VRRCEPMARAAATAILRGFSAARPGRSMSSAWRETTYQHCAHSSSTSMRHPVTLIRGDGTGPELARVTRDVLDATGVKFDWVEVEAGVDIMASAGTPLPQNVLDSIKKTKTAIKAPITTPVGTGFRSVNVALRKEFDLYACLRPCKSYEGVRSRYEKVDLVIFRENTEDLYAGIEFEKGQKNTGELIEFIKNVHGAKIRPDSGISIKPISVFGTTRIVKAAFEYARANKRKKVTAVHKSNIMKFSDGLFLATAREVAALYPEIEFNDVIVDNMCMQLVQKPELYDVIVLPNLYGDVLSDLCAGLVGGLGVAPGANLGDGGIAIFEATHGSAPKYKGLNKVNPAAMLLSGMLMLKHLGENAAAVRLEKAIAKVFAEGKHVTYDMKPHRDDPTAVGTREMGQAIIDAMSAVTV